MAAIDEIREAAQNVYFTINDVENDDEDEDLEIFENEFIRAFNLFREEYETEDYWNNLRVNDFVLATINNTNIFSFTLPEEYRTPVIQQDKYLKFVLPDGTIIAKFKMVDPNQRVIDDDYLRKDRAAFVGRNIVLSRTPRESELTAKIVLDVVLKIPKLTRNDSTALDLMLSSQIYTLGVAKNKTLGNVVKGTLSSPFAQKYNNELQKLKNINNASTDVDDMQSEDYGYITGIGF